MQCHVRQQSEKEVGAGDEGMGGMQKTPPPYYFWEGGYPPYPTTTLAFSSNGFVRIARLKR